MLRHRADVAVHSTNGSLQLEVEVKTKRGASPDWAARLVRNMLAHESAPSAPYFMLVLPDKIYLWNLRGRPLTDASMWKDGGSKPDYEADSAPLFGPYMEGGRGLLADFGKESLILVVASSLADLFNSDYTEARGRIPHPGLQALLFGSGLYDSARQGAVSTEVVFS